MAALREWIGRYARFAATKRGMLDSLQAGLAPTALPMPGSRERLAAAVEALLTAGVENGTLRDVDPDDVVMLLLGVFLATSSAADTEQPARLLDLVLDALKVQPDGADPLPRA